MSKTETVVSTEDMEVRSPDGRSFLVHLSWFREESLTKRLSLSNGGLGRSRTTGLDPVHLLRSTSRSITEGVLSWWGLFYPQGDPSFVLLITLRRTSQMVVREESPCETLTVSTLTEPSALQCLRRLRFNIRTHST